MATPDAFVVTVMLEIIADEEKLARVVPAVIVSVRGLLNAAPPDESRSVTPTLAELAILIVRGLIESDILAGVGGGGEPIWSWALLFIVRYEAVIVTNPPGLGVERSVKVTVATPEALVTAVVADNDPEVKPPRLNDTDNPLMPPDASDTVAETVVLPSRAMDGVPSDTTIEVGVRAGVPIVIVALPLYDVEPTVTVAIMVAVVSFLDAVKVVVAEPEASVTAEAGLHEPYDELITEKETDAFGTGLAKASLTVAVTVVEPPFAIDADASETFTLATEPVCDDVTGALTLPTPQPIEISTRQTIMVMTGNLILFICFPPGT